MFAVANLLLRFLLELAALVALGAWGWQTGGPVLGLLLPLAAAVLWGAFASPKSHASTPVKLATQVLVLGGATLSLLATRDALFAAAFGAVVLANAALLTAEGQSLWRNCNGSTVPT
jgi:hypothetical protein